MGISVEGANKRFGDFQALDDVSIDVPDGSLTALLGPSGSGKSTLLRAIAGLEDLDGGVVTIDGEDATGKPAQKRGVGFVFQHYAAFKHMTVFDNVAFGLKIRNWRKSEISDRVHELLQLVQLDGLAGRTPSQLSGGQRQRMALARALAVQPQVLLLDEPFGALDAHVRQELRRWLDGLHRELGVTSLLVTHDQEEALELASAVVVMRRGRVEQAAPPVDIYNRPATPFVAGFVGSSNVVRGTVEGDDLHFGHSAVTGADHVACGAQAQAYIRPHDVLLARTRGVRSFPVTIERRTNLGWLSKLQLRLADGQAIFAELPNEELDGIGEGEHVYANLRSAKVFSLDAGDPPSGAADSDPGKAAPYTSDESEVMAAGAGGER
jgi:sulfate/thiosulfate transport system ATP-binding protein